MKQGKGLLRATAWRGPLFILPFRAEGHRRVSHATPRHPAGQPWKGAIAVGKEGLAIGINYSQWRGLCLQFSSFFFSKRSRRGKEFNPNHRLSASLLESYVFQVTSLPSLHPQFPESLSPPTITGMLWGFGCYVWMRVAVLQSFIT